MFVRGPHAQISALLPHNGPISSPHTTFHEVPPESASGWGSEHPRADPSGYAAVALGRFHRRPLPEVRAISWPKESERPPGGCSNQESSSLISARLTFPSQHVRERGVLFWLISRLVLPHLLRLPHPTPSFGGSTWAAFCCIDAIKSIKFSLKFFFNNSFN